MAVLPMQRVSICALKKDRKAILEKIQSMGIMEMNQVAEGEEGFGTMDTVSARLSFDKKAQTAEQALAVLETYAPEKQSIFASLAGKDLVEKEKFDGTVADREEILETASLLLTDHKKIAEDKASIQKLENQIETLTPWLNLDVPMNYAGTKKAAMLLGTMPKETTLESIYARFADQELEAVDVETVYSDRDAVYLAVFCMRESENKVEEVLRAEGFARPAQAVEEIPRRQKEILEAEIQKLNKRIEETEEEIRQQEKSREPLKMISDYYRMRAEKYAVLGTLPQSQRTFVMSGYVPARFVPAVQKAIGEKFDCVLDIEEVKEEEDSPTVLKNNSFSASMEGVVASYGLPNKKEVDPTTIMSFFYVFFFGMMLSDAAYGAIIAIVCFVLLKKFPRMSSGMHKSLKMFMYCGISTVVWGILFGGYFGDVIPVVSETFFGTRINVDALWFVPLDDPMKLLIYSMLFGLIHLFVGHGIKGYMCLKDGNIKDFICDVVLWYVFLIGLILMLIPSDIFASVAQTKIVFPPVLNTLAKALAIIGAVGLLLMSGRDNKNPALRLALGAYDIYNVTGWLSDVLSYSRLLALGLATGVIASVINEMGSMFGNGILGAIGFIIVFIIGHTMNMGINILGAYVHTNRLQFVEFFGKFYDGSGRPFNPFESNTKYVAVKEETKS